MHSEVIERLADAFSAHGISMAGELSEKDADLVTQAHMMVYVLTGTNYTTMHPGWSDIITWVHDANHSFVWNEQTKMNPLKPRDITFPVIVHIAEEIGERFGRFQDVECRGKKETLLAMEIEGTKIVSLSKFHGYSLDGGWQFSESHESLRCLGALHETGPNVNFNRFSPHAFHLDEKIGFFIAEASPDDRPSTFRSPWQTKVTPHHISEPSMTTEEQKRMQDCKCARAVFFWPSANSFFFCVKIWGMWLTKLAVAG